MSTGITALCASALRGAEPKLPQEHAWAEVGEHARIAIPMLRYDGRSPITVQARVCLHATQGMQSVAGDMHAGGHGLYLEGGHWHFAVHNGKQYLRATSDAPAIAETCVELAGVCDGVWVRLYVNGVMQKSSMRWSGTYRASKQAWMIGMDPDAQNKPQHRLMGAVSSVRVSRVARDRIARWMQTPFGPADAGDVLYLSAEGNAVEPLVHRTRTWLPVTQEGVTLHEKQPMDVQTGDRQ